MTTALLIYLYITINNIVSIGLLVTTIAIPLIMCVAYYMFDMEAGVEEYRDSLNKLKLKFVIALWVIFLSIGTLVPNKQDMAWILGGTAAVAVASKDEAQKLPDNLLKAANIFLEEIQEEKKNEQ